MANRWPDVACDQWIIREWQASEALRSGEVAACNAVLAEELDDDEAGYGLPDDYTCGPRLHVFADDDCEVWIGCFNPMHVSPAQCSRIALMTEEEMMHALIRDGGPYVLLLDGRAVVAEHRGR